MCYSFEKCARNSVDVNDSLVKHTYTDNHDQKKERQIESNVDGYSSVGLVPFRSFRRNRHCLMFAEERRWKSCKGDVSLREKADTSPLNEPFTVSAQIVRLKERRGFGCSCCR